MKRFHEKPNHYVKEVSIKVTSLERSITFYKETIGFQVLSQTDRQAVLTADGQQPLLTLTQPENVSEKRGRTTGLYHFALLLPSRASLGSFLKHVSQMGVQVGAGDHHVSEALYLDDPDGNGIEVYHDRPATEWEWSDGMVKMTTDPVDGESLVKEGADNWDGLPAETVMGHIHLHVGNLEKAEEFYMKGLSFTSVKRLQGALFISTGDYHHHIGLNIWSGEGAAKPAINSVGLNWYTLVFADEADRAGTIERLKEIGAVVTEEEDNIVTEDPFGHKIRLVI